MCAGRFEEAKKSFETALTLDPLSLMIGANVGFCLYFQRRYAEAIEQVEKTISMETSLAPPHYYLGLANEQIGNFDVSIREFERSVELSGGVPGDLGSLGHALATAGRISEAQDVLTRLKALSTQGYVTSFHEGLIELRLRGPDAALAQFEHAVVERDFYLIYLNIDPRLDTLQFNPRFVEIAKTVTRDRV